MTVRPQLVAALVLAGAITLGAVALAAMHGQDRSTPANPPDSIPEATAPAPDALPPIDTGLADPWAVLVDEEGRIWVGADGVVAAFDLAGKRVAEIPIDGKATALASDDGWLWVGVTDHVEMFSLETLQRVEVGEVLPEGARLTSLAPAFQSLWAADAANRLVLLLDRDGNAIAVLASVEYVEAHRFAVPSPYFDVAEDADERLLVTDPGRHRVEIWEQGEKVGTWGRAGTDPAGFAGCCGPANLAVLPDGGIAAVDKGMPRLKVYEPDGTLRAMIADETQFADFSRACDARTAGSIALDVAVTDTGRIVILEPCTGRLRFFDPPAPSDEP